MNTEHLQQILFLDIETVSESRQFADLDEYWQELWDQKTRFQRGEEESPADFYPKRAGILAEFGKVVCISCGYFVQRGSDWEFRLKSFADEDEFQVLDQFAQLLDKLPRFVLCGHNAKEFDFPYLTRRMIKHDIKLPPQLRNWGKKPWEIPHLDTLELWKFGDYKNYTSLKLLAQMFGLPSPKDDIDGSQVGQVFWEEGDLKRIRVYCEKDVLTLAKVYLKMVQIDAVRDFETHSVTD